MEKFVDHLMQIYDDSKRSQNPSWHAGRNMFENKREYKDKDTSGFKKELIDKGQNNEVTRHILGHGGVILAGRGMDDKFDLIPGRRGIGELGGYIVSGIAQLSDILQKYFGNDAHKKGEADVEILDDYVARDVANAFTRAYDGKYTREQLRKKLLNLLGY
ncbi:hypothetical protein J7L67_03640 [bacterium]|nr:hypothetical protein [bacterium]